MRRVNQTVKILGTPLENAVQSYKTVGVKEVTIKPSQLRLPVKRGGRLAKLTLGGQTRVDRSSQDRLVRDDAQSVYE